jgi:hypothetical protein
VAKIASAVAKSSKLASELIAATGLCCLRTGVLAGHQHHSRVTTGGIADRDLNGSRIWLQSPKSAERIVSELFRKHGMRRDGTLVIEAVPDEVDRLLRDSARLLGIGVLEDAQIDALMTSLSKRTGAAIAGMGLQGTLKRLQRITEFDLTGLLARQA